LILDSPLLINITGKVTRILNYSELEGSLYLKK
jgi:hypothetical protein